jgi:hypothetical protein
MAFAAGYPRRHYYEPLMVPIALGSGVVFAWLSRAFRERRRRSTWVLATCAAAVWVGPVLNHIDYLTHVPERLSISPFDSSESIAHHVATRTRTGECLLIVGSEFQVHFFAERPPCSRLVFTYPLTGRYSYAADLRREFLADLAERQPRYVLVYALPDSIGVPDGQLFLDEVLAAMQPDYELEATLPGPDFPRPDDRDYVRVYRHRSAEAGAAP